ncbi:MAG: low-specificity L-threonine aldolase [Desulfobacterales bacterium]
MQPIDLRSDTITHPTPSMRDAMSRAVVGDDVFGEDPTVRRLEDMAAERLGKAAALLVPSGTMANLVALLSHCDRGDEVILGDQSHIYFYEQGGAAAVGGLHPRPLPNRPDGTLPPDAVESAVRPDDIHFPRTRLVVLENTHNRCNGEALTPEYIEQMGDLVHRRGLDLHVDGARIFNAASALGCTPARLAGPADSIGFCLSKGLAAPVGSVLCGDEAFIAKARRNRKLLGGGMRQAGVIAAAGIVALTEMTDRLAEDHAHAALLAQGLESVPGLQVPPAIRRTNIVYADIVRDEIDAQSLCTALAERGVRVLAAAPRRIRAVLHYQITAEAVERAVETFRSVMAQRS